MRETFTRDLQYAKFSAYGFLKNLRFFEPFMVLFLLEQGIGFLQVGMLYAIREIAVNVLEIPTGAVADALGRRRTMIASFGSYLLSFVAFWFGSSMLHFVGAMLLFSFGEAFRTGTHKAMIFAHLRLRGLERLGNDYYGHTRSWSQAGSAVSALIAAAIVFGAGNYRSVFLFSMIPYVLDLVLMTTYPKELDGTTGTFRSSAIGENLRAIGAGLRETVRRPGAARSVFSAASFAGLFKGTKDYLQPMIAALALSVPFAPDLAIERREALLIGIAYSVVYAVTSVASRHSARVAAKFGPPGRALNWQLAIGLLLATGAGVSRWLALPVLPVVLFMGMYVLQNLRQPVGVACVSGRVPESVLATVLSAQSQLQSLFAALTAFAVGAVAEAAGGNVGPGILAVGLVAAVCVPFLWIRVSAGECPAR
ncbi:MAG: MFS transporter [Spirochaetota bacterium]